MTNRHEGPSSGEDLAVSQSQPVSESVPLSAREAELSAAEPGLLTIPEVIERLRVRAYEHEDPLDPHSVSRRVLKVLLKGLDDADKFKWQVRDTCARAERAEAQVAGLREALKGLLDACHYADNLGELHDAISGELLDAASAALSQALGADQ